MAKIIERLPRDMNKDTLYLVGSLANTVIFALRCLYFNWNFAAAFVTTGELLDFHSRISERLCVYRDKQLDDRESCMLKAIRARTAPVVAAEPVVADVPVTVVSRGVQVSEEASPAAATPPPPVPDSADTVVIGTHKRSLGEYASLRQQACCLMRPEHVLSCDVDSRLLMITEDGFLGLKRLGRYLVLEPGTATELPGGDCVLLTTEDGRVALTRLGRYLELEPGTATQLRYERVTCFAQHCDITYVGTDRGVLEAYERGSYLDWREAKSISLFDGIKPEAILHIFAVTDSEELIIAVSAHVMAYCIGSVCRTKWRTSDLGLQRIKMAVRPTVPLLDGDSQLDKPQVQSLSKLLLVADDAGKVVLLDCSQTSPVVESWQLRTDATSTAYAMAVSGDHLVVVSDCRVLKLQPQSKVLKLWDLPHPFSSVAILSDCICALQDKEVFVFQRERGDTLFSFALPERCVFVPGPHLLARSLQSNHYGLQSVFLWTTSLLDHLKQIIVTILSRGCSRTPFVPQLQYSIPKEFKECTISIHDGLDFSFYVDNIVTLCSHHPTPVKLLSVQPVDDSTVVARAEHAIYRLNVSDCRWGYLISVPNCVDFGVNDHFVYALGDYFLMRVPHENHRREEWDLPVLLTEYSKPHGRLERKLIMGAGVVHVVGFAPKKTTVISTFDESNCCFRLVDRMTEWPHCGLKPATFPTADVVKSLGAVTVLKCEPGCGASTDESCDVLM
eukprot:TRINITY_DN2847_c0_g1_i1.p1 TRINITY_DN2847_c0_g1~~TRINITY_DN2847_c0_g1_i1.p1  ORF type:complete len:773 (+),score=87.27 TRINITY_DN2847_c0_g1_i1:130-2319(+)